MGGFLFVLIAVISSGCIVSGESCPPEVPFVNCTTNPCDFPLAICPLDPSARCRPDYCGGCVARFYDYLDREVHCEQDINIICELKNNTIGCQAAPGTVMKVRYANYGRLDVTTCLHPFDDNYDHYDTNCHSETTTIEIIKRQCEGRLSCHPRAINAIFGDPCPRTYKYLEIDYTCVAPAGSKGSSMRTASAWLHLTLLSVIIYSLYSD